MRHAQLSKEGDGSICRQQCGVWVGGHPFGIRLLLSFTKGQQISPVAAVLNYAYSSPW